MGHSVTCVFVHGWAMNSAVWAQSIAQLPHWINAVVVDLPGHGSMAAVSADNIDDYVQVLKPLVQQPAIWVGWSLGGLAVLRLAERYPQRVAAALLVTSNPCFVRQPGWSCGVDAAVFSQFANELQNDQQKTIRRFLALQVKGLPDAMPLARHLQQSLQTRGQASTVALAKALNILLTTDLRQALNTIDCPLHWLFGAKDALVPRHLASVLQQQYGQKNVLLHPHASHAPFISHAEDFVKQLINIAQQQRTKNLNSIKNK